MCLLCLAAWTNEIQSSLFWPISSFISTFGSLPTWLPFFFRSLLIIVNIIVTHIDGCNSLLWFLEETFEAILGAVQTIQAAKGPWKENGFGRSGPWNFKGENDWENQLKWFAGHEVAVLFLNSQNEIKYKINTFFKRWTYQVSPSFHYASPLLSLEGFVFMLRFSPMEWWLWNARTGFWISLPQTQMQTRERTNSQSKTWILLWYDYFFPKTTRKRNFRSISLHLLLNFLQMFKVKTPGLPCRMRHIFRSLKSLKIFSRMAPFSPILHQTFWILSFPTAGAVPCKGKRLPSRRRRAWDFPSGGKRALTSAVQYWTPMEMIGNEPWPNQTKSRGVF